MSFPEPAAAGKPRWFVVAEGPHAGEWHMAGWFLSAVKGEEFIASGGAVLDDGWYSFGTCPRCFVLVPTKLRGALPSDMTWAHEQWHHETDYPHPEIAAALHRDIPRAGITNPSGTSSPDEQGPDPGKPAS